MSHNMTAKEVKAAEVAFYKAWAERKSKEAPDPKLMAMLEEIIRIAKGLK